MVLWQQLRIEPGIICLTGSGGKTTLAHRLAAQLPGSVIFCTTTKIYPSAQMPVLCDPEPSEVRAALRRSRAVCIGTPTEEGKLISPSIPVSRLRELADYVLVEADGSKGLPMKAHLEYEPVMPDGWNRSIRLIGAEGFDKPIAEAAHRPERFAALAGVSVDTVLTPELAAAVLRQEGGFDTLIVNQAASAAQMGQANRLAMLLKVPVFAGQIREGILFRMRRDGWEKAEKT